MGRPLRIEFAGAIQHVTARGNAHEPIYRDRWDRKLFLDICADVIASCRWRCHAYCLMGNHYHLILETPEPNVAAGVHRLHCVYARWFNRRHGRLGRVFEDRYKTILIEKESHLLEVARYVVLNPVRAGISGTPEEWPWSSYHATAGVREPPEFLTVDWILGQFANERSAAQERYRAFVDAAPNRKPWERIRRRVYLGSDEFVRAHA